MTLQRNHAPFHPADAYLVRRAYRQGVRTGQRHPDDGIATYRERWLRRHGGEAIGHRLPDWEDGFRDGQFMQNC